MSHDTHKTLLVAIYRRRATAQQAVERLIEHDFPMDQISLLGKAFETGDDILGIYHSKVGERMKAWGEQGAFWGGLWGLLSGASGMFLFPGLGPLMAAGPVVEAIVGALGGAALGGGAMAAAGAASQIATVLHRMGIPQHALDELREAIQHGAFVLILQGGADELAAAREQLAAGAERIVSFTDAGLTA